VKLTKFASGTRFTVYGLVVNNKCLAQEFIDSLQESDKKKIVALIGRIIDRGLPVNERKFRYL